MVFPIFLTCWYICPKMDLIMLLDISFCVFLRKMKRDGKLF